MTGRYLASKKGLVSSRAMIVAQRSSGNSSMGATAPERCEEPDVWIGEALERGFTAAFVIRQAGCRIGLAGTSVWIRFKSTARTSSPSETRRSTTASDRSPFPESDRPVHARSPGSLALLAPAFDALLACRRHGNSLLGFLPCLVLADPGAIILPESRCPQGPVSANQRVGTKGRRARQGWTRDADAVDRSGRRTDPGGAGCRPA